MLFHANIVNLLKFCLLDSQTAESIVMKMGMKIAEYNITSAGIIVERNWSYTFEIGVEDARCQLNLVHY